MNGTRNMAKIILALYFLIFWLVPYSQARNAAPQFEDYPVVGKFKGINAPLKISRNDSGFRSKLSKAAKRKPNFAGHYILAFWGCGMECLMGTVIDAVTGDIYPLPFTLCCWGSEFGPNFNPISFRLDSKLIIFTGVRDEQEGDNGKHFYIFDGQRFVSVTSQAVQQSGEVNGREIPFKN